MQELSLEEVKSIGGGGSNWQDIGYAVGYGVGRIGNYVYERMMLTDLWLDDINPF